MCFMYVLQSEGPPLVMKEGNKKFGSCSLYYLACREKQTTPGASGDNKAKSKKEKRKKKKWQKERRISYFR